MPIDPIAALKYLGFDPETVENDEVFKAEVTKTYVKRENAHADDEIAARIFGKVNGTLRSKLKAHAKELGIDGEFDKLDPVDGIDLLGKTTKTRFLEHATAMDDIKKGIKPAKEVEELERKYTESKSLSDQLKEQLGSWETKYKDLEGSVQKREKQSRVDAQWERAFGGLKFNEGTSKLTVEGFKHAARAKYEIGFDDEGAIYAMDATTKKRVPNPDKAHDSLPVDELVRAYAAEEKLIGGTPQGGTRVRKTMSLLGGETETRKVEVADDGLPKQRLMPRRL